uniref:DM domain-containing protein n=1 Tax=Trichobilharzia regenti TaxID=157069 RepID=A0AA85K9V2_TRIRE|nr:unnamed protein product [Trichobilharzia regenti]
MKNPEGISSSIFKQEPTDDNSSLQPPSSISSVNQSCHNRLIDNNNNNIYLNDQHFNLTAYPYSNAVTIDTINKTNSILSITDEKLIPTSQTMITNNNNLITKKFQNPFINFNLTNQFSYPLSSLPLSPSSSSHQTSDSIQYVNTSLQDVNYSTSAASVLIPSSIFDASQLPTTIAASTSTMNSNLNTNTTSSLHNQRASISRNSLKSSLLNSVTRTSQSSVSSSPLTCYHTSKTSSTLTTSTHNRLLGNQQCGISSRSNVQNDHSRPFNPPPPPSQPQNQSAPTSSSHHHPHHHRHHHHHLHHYRNTSICSRASYMCRKCKTHGHNIPVKRHKRTCPYTNCTCIKCHLVDQGRKVVARQIALYRDQKGNSHRDIHDQLDGNRVQPTNNGSWRSSSISSLSSTTTTISTTTTTTTTSANINLEINKTDEIKINKNLNNNRSNNSNNHLSNHSGIHTTINDSNTKTNSVLLPLSHSSSLRSVVALIDEKQTITSGPHCRRCRNHSIAVTWKGHKKTCPFRNCPCDPCRLINVRKDTEKTLREMGRIPDCLVSLTMVLSLSIMFVFPIVNYCWLVTVSEIKCYSLLNGMKIQPVSYNAILRGPTEITWAITASCYADG